MRPCSSSSSSSPSSAPSPSTATPRPVCPATTAASPAPDPPLTNASPASRTTFTLRAVVSPAQPTASPAWRGEPQESARPANRSSTSLSRVGVASDAPREPWPVPSQQSSSVFRATTCRIRCVSSACRTAYSVPTPIPASAAEVVFN